MSDAGYVYDPSGRFLTKHDVSVLRNQYRSGDAGPESDPHVSDEDP